MAPNHTPSANVIVAPGDTPLVPITVRPKRRRARTSTLVVRSSKLTHPKFYGDLEQALRTLSGRNLVRFAKRWTERIDTPDCPDPASLRFSLSKLAEAEHDVALVVALTLILETSTLSELHSSAKDAIETWHFGQDQLYGRTVVNKARQAGII